MQGAAADTAAWVTNVGNERGEIVQSVLTASEGTPSPAWMAEGIMERYKKADKPPSCLLYKDQDCCSRKFHDLFGRCGESWWLDWLCGTI